MDRRAWNPLLPEPLPAVLVGAGFFLLLVALSPLGPLVFPSLSAGAAPSAPVPVLTAERVLEGPPPEGDAARVDALAKDLAWLRSQGAGLIVLEAWMDQSPQADARALDDELWARFEALPPGRARSRGLQVLSATAAELDAPQRLCAALQAARPLLLPFQAQPGAGAGLPAALKDQAYVVSLRGEAQTLAPYQVQRLPFDAVLSTGTALAALPEDLGPLAAPVVVCVSGHWIDGLGLEAARLTLGLPLDGLRYRWHQGLLNSLELADRRYGLDASGALFPAQAGGSLPELSMEALRQDPSGPAGPRGKTIFLRPWPLQSADARAFDAQSAVFLALTQRGAASAAEPPGPREKAACLGACLACVLALAFLPVWVAVPLGCVAPIAAWYLLQGRPTALAEALACALAALCLGLGWRLQRLRLKGRDAERLLRGMCAERHQVDWLRRLRKGSALPAAYAVVGPRALMQGPVWEAWMERWGALMDEGSPVDGVGLILAEPEAAEAMAKALLDLRRQLNGMSGAVSRGTLSVRAQRRLGANVWEIHGPVKDGVLELFARAGAEELLVSSRDVAEFSDFVEFKVLKPRPGGEREAVANILGPKANLWGRRP